MSNNPLYRRYHTPTLEINIFISLAVQPYHSRTVLYTYASFEYSFQDDNKHSKGTVDSRYPWEIPTEILYEKDNSVAAVIIHWMWCRPTVVWFTASQLYGLIVSKLLPKWFRTTRILPIHSCRKGNLHRYHSCKYLQPGRPEHGQHCKQQVQSRSN